MGIHDRPYWREGSSQNSWGGGTGGMGGVRIGLPRPAPAVKTLLIVNLAVFVAQMLVNDRQTHALTELFGVTVSGFWQVWRYLTFQFLHASFWHIALNMLGLYMLGTPLEHRYGTRRFVGFYLACGVTAGIAYVIIGAAGNLNPDMPIIGASGGVYGIVLAAAVYFPHFRLIFLFFPVPIRLAAIIIFGGMILLVLEALRSGATGAAMSDVAHLGGAATAAVYIWVLPRLRSAQGEVRSRLNEGAWQRRMHRRQDEQAEIDRILAKVHDQGLNSLTDKERRILREATRHQQTAENDLYKP